MIELKQVQMQDMNARSKGRIQIQAPLELLLRTSKISSFPRPTLLYVHFDQKYFQCSSIRSVLIWGWKPQQVLVFCQSIVLTVTMKSRRNKFKQRFVQGDSFRVWSQLQKSEKPRESDDPMSNSRNKGVRRHTRRNIVPPGNRRDSDFVTLKIWVASARNFDFRYW